ncbi:hypothetical protein QBC37DRAFT_19736 [Rhypophila decipiens]|uniref:Secreted protein n=1 Tax=Rhypophila decipiens TaxID=261697 RepID=A0AAN6Y804_9PEZI|nr:hypothetical protein QBC37DRAFT_19736 [Rhypophila decipiens]
MFVSLLLLFSFFGRNDAVRVRACLLLDCIDRHFRVVRIASWTGMRGWEDRRVTKLSDLVYMLDVMLVSNPLVRFCLAVWSGQASGSAAAPLVW